MNKFKKFIISYLALVALLAVVSGAAFRLFWPDLYPPMLFMIPIIFVIMLALLLLVWHLIERKDKPAQLALTVYRPLKMFVLMIFVVLAVIADKQFALPFIAAFALFYIVLSVCEMSMLVKIGRK